MEARNSSLNSLISLISLISFTFGIGFEDQAISLSSRGYLKRRAKPEQLYLISAQPTPRESAILNTERCELLAMKVRKIDWGACSLRQCF